LKRRFVRKSGKADAGKAEGASSSPQRNLKGACDQKDQNITQPPIAYKSSAVYLKARRTLLGEPGTPKKKVKKKKSLS